MRILMVHDNCWTNKGPLQHHHLMAKLSPKAGDKPNELEEAAEVVTNLQGRPRASLRLIQEGAYQ